MRASRPGGRRVALRSTSTGLASRASVGWWLLHVAYAVLVLVVSGPWAMAWARNCAGGGAPRPDEGGIGGTGIVQQRPRDEGGIGGTGVQSRDENIDGGVVGSGVSATNRIGVVGTITGFASICVGDLEIHYEESTPVEIDGIQTSVAALAVGQVVEVIAGDVANGAASEYYAHRIASHHVVAGSIHNLDTSTNRMTVLGQTVQIVAATRVEASTNAAPLALAEGDQVRVSGMRRADGVIVASRISPLEKNAPVRLIGTVANVAGGRFEVSGVPVQVQGTAIPAVGAQIRVAGAWDGTLLQAQLVESLSILPFEGRVARVEVEGFARRTSSDTIQLGDFEVHVPQPAWEPQAADFDAVGTRLRVQAIVREQHLVAERVVRVREPGPAAIERGPYGAGGSGSSSEGKESADPQRQQDSDSVGGRPRQPASVSGSDASRNPYRELRSGESGGEVRMAPGIERPVDRPRGEPPFAERPQIQAPPQFERPAMERPQRPEIPQRPQVPNIPERPPRPERPQAVESRPR